MKAEEALRLLNDMEFDKNYQGVQEYTEMFTVCKGALEKQVAKKVTKSACPSCNRIFLFRHSEKRKGDYCDNCGQALDWSDKNETN